MDCHSCLQKVWLGQHALSGMLSNVTTHVIQISCRRALPPAETAGAGFGEISWRVLRHIWLTEGLA